MLSIKTPIVSVDWLLKHYDEPNLVILDTAMKKATTAENDVVEVSKVQLKNARFLDIQNAFSNSASRFPNTMLSAQEFSKAAQKLGINNDSAIVVYDTIGIYASPRVWWMFKAMGHSNIAVLDGGLPAWRKAKLPLEKGKEYKGEQGNFEAVYNSDFFSNRSAVLKAIKDTSKLTLDSRTHNRFLGITPEPRERLRSGHIPGSINLPYTKLIENQKMKSNKELSGIFNEIVTKDTELIFSCGSGITACILALGAEIIGLENKSVYDGSWTEWGSFTELPIETK